MKINKKKKILKQHMVKKVLYWLGDCAKLTLEKKIEFRSLVHKIIKVRFIQFSLNFFPRVLKTV